MPAPLSIFPQTNIAEEPLAYPGLPLVASPALSGGSVTSADWFAIRREEERGREREREAKEHRKVSQRVLLLKLSAAHRSFPRSLI